MSSDATMDVYSCVDCISTLSNFIFHTYRDDPILIDGEPLDVFLRDFVTWCNTNVSFFLSSREKCNMVATYPRQEPSDLLHEFVHIALYHDCKYTCAYCLLELLSSFVIPICHPTSYDLYLISVMVERILALQIDPVLDPICILPISEAIQQSGEQFGSKAFIANMFVSIDRDPSSKSSLEYMHSVVYASKNYQLALLHSISNYVVSHYHSSGRQIIMEKFLKTLKNKRFASHGGAIRIYETLFGAQSQFGFDFNHFVHVESSTARELTTKFLECIENFKAKFSEYSNVVCLLWFFYDIYKKESLPIALARFASCSLSEAVTKDVIRHATALYTVRQEQQHVESYPEATEQVGLDDLNVLKSTINVLFNLLFTGHYKSVLEQRIARTSLDAHAKQIKNSKTIVDYYTNLFTVALDFVKSIFQSEEQIINKLETTEPKMVKWVHEVDDLLKQTQGKSIHTCLIETPQIFQQVVELRRVADIWIDNLSKFHSSSAFWSIFLEKYRRFNKLHDELVKVHGTYANRKGPFVFIIKGSPGVGKSHMITYILRSLYKIDRKEFNSAKDMYMRAGDSKYWDGYVGQKVTYYNDLFQTQDEEVRKAVAMEFISMAQTTPMPLNCAHLDLKDKNFFSSEIVCGDLNRYPTDNQLHALVAEPDAFKRRTTNIIEAKLLPEFAKNGRFDLDKCNRPFQYDAYEFHVNVNGMPRVMGWRALITWLYTELQKHREVQSRNLMFDECDIDDDFVHDLNPLEVVEQTGNDSRYDSDDEVCVPKDSWRVWFRNLTAYQSISLWYARLFCTPFEYSIRDSVRQAVQFRSQTKKWIGACSVLGFLGLFFYMICKSRENDSEEIVSELSGGSSEPVRAPRIVRVRKRVVPEMATTSCVPERPKRVVRRVVASKEESSYFEPCEMAITKLAQSQRRLVSQSGFTICAWMVHSHVMAVPNHFFKQIGENDIVVLYSSNARWEFHARDLNDKVVCLERDLALVQLSNKIVPPARGLANLLVDEEQRLPSMATIVNCRSFKADGLNLIRHSIMDLDDASKIVWSKQALGELRANVSEVLSYSADTRAGDCGSLVVIMDKTLTPRIAGMHIAGGEGRGHATRITTELIQDMLEELTQTSPREQAGLDFSFPDCDEPGPGMPVTNSDLIDVVGVLHPGEVPRLPKRTKIKKSLIHGIFPVTTQPAMLRPTNGIDPLRNGIVKMCRENVCLNMEILDHAVKCVKHRLIALKSPYRHKPRILTNDEAINGVEGDPRIRAINMKTSPGWPYNLASKKSGKTDFFEGDVGCYVMKPELAERVDQFERSLLEGKPEPFYFFDCLKDERRPEEKARSGNTRVFSVGPIHFSLMMRKYTAEFQAHCMYNCTEGGSAVGINPHSPDWGALLARLQQGGDNFIAGDYGKWDKWVPYQLMMAVCDIVTDFYQDHDTTAAVARQCLFQRAFAARRIALSAVYETTGGMPSGTPGTAVFNSIANEILFRYMFELLRRKYDPDMSPHIYSELVQFTAYGDDHIAAVSEVVPWFNMVNLSKEFTKMNIEYTTADKSTTVMTREYVPLQELTYLKRRFVKQGPLLVMAPLDHGVICESANWSRNEASKENLKSIYNSIMLELVHHGEDEFDFIGNKLAVACARVGIGVSAHSYKHILARIQDGVIDHECLLALCDPCVVLG